MPRHEAPFSVDEVDGVDTVDRVNDGAMSTTSTTSTTSTRQWSSWLWDHAIRALNILRGLARVETSNDL
jgi:hypothetical protein